ncbi:preprotein translocase subunit SecE [Metamycoplasma neophronis]|uniref:Preprotein translocase subunit SecE n=2 Tax=Metamycoplasma neophronis TaxID=872983 RepID=A0ABY2Z0F3_9BACT|nr:preprotein translocase subunit SecE [Metamycoplasma neophronis]
MKQDAKAQKAAQKAQAKAEKANNKNKAKSSTMRNWVKEIKRIVWPKSSKAWKWFWITIAFLIVMGLFCFLITLGFTSLWNSVGIKA